jgi:hypothetical protein
MCIFKINFSVRKIQHSFQDIENPFILLNLVSKLSAYVIQKWGTVQPVEKVLGVRIDNTRNTTTGPDHSLLCMFYVLFSLIWFSIRGRF